MITLLLKTVQNERTVRCQCFADPVIFKFYRSCSDLSDKSMSDIRDALRSSPALCADVPGELGVPGARCDCCSYGRCLPEAVATK